MYKPKGENLYDVDVNSLYPFTALKEYPGLNCTYIENLDKGLSIDSLFGFFYAEVETNDQYFGLLPVKTNEGLVFPQGKFSGIWFSEEIKFALMNNYKIKILYGVNFDKINSPFKEYVENLYNKKIDAEGANRIIIKSLLNNLIGRFGLNIYKPLMEEVDLEKWSKIANTKEITSHIPLNDNKFLITYYPNVSKDICHQHGLNYTEEWIKNKEENKSI